ncbi:MAG TPA: ATP cone domain-containing protein, partial [Methanotrichaceae archaeon]|nr:ATP cone domain-containing protein [Methanotrichaceae archaeon]
MKSIRKRDGRIVEFQPGKIAAAIGKAFKAVGTEDAGKSSELAGRVVKIAEEKFPSAVPGVEDI